MRFITNKVATFEIYNKDTETGEKELSKTWKYPVFFVSDINKFKYAFNSLTDKLDVTDDYSKIKAGITLSEKRIMESIDRDRKAVTVIVDNQRYYIIDIRHYATTTFSGGEIMLGEGQYQ